MSKYVVSFTPAEPGGKSVTTVEADSVHHDEDLLTFIKGDEAVLVIALRCFVGFEVAK